MISPKPNIQLSACDELTSQLSFLRTLRLGIHKALAECGLSRFFIKNLEQVWYQRDLLGVNQNRSETITWLKHMLANMSRLWVFLGASARSYAARFFGLALKMLGITAFGTQTLANRSAWCGYVERKHRDANFVLEAPQNNFIPRVRNTPRKGVIDLHYIGHNNLAIRQNQPLSEFDCLTLHPHNHKRHDAAWHLKELGTLSNTLQNALTSHKTTHATTT